METKQIFYKETPSNAGQKWSNEEEILLLDELNKNMDIEIIAKKHNRSIGGINARRREIAYKLSSSNISIEDIIIKTKLDKEEILETIKRRQNKSIKNNIIIENTKILSTENQKTLSIENEIYGIKNGIYGIKNEIYGMKNEIKELKYNIKELIEMMKAVYEFEDAF